VGDDERRPTGQEQSQGALDLPLGADVDGRRGLVEDEEAWIGQQRARERDELALSE
jgi:hypothetical protein